MYDAVTFDRPLENNDSFEMDVDGHEVVITMKANKYTGATGDPLIRARVKSENGVYTEKQRYRRWLSTDEVIKRAVIKAITTAQKHQESKKERLVGSGFNKVEEELSQSSL